METKATKICFFNNKSGVGKTTNIFNIGWKLSEMGKKVLLVDADSQCNLTLLSIGIDKFEEYYQKDVTSDIKTALEPAFKSQTQLIKPVECTEIKDNLYLMPGHIDLSTYEVQLGISFQINSFTSMQNIPGSFNYLFETTAKKYDVDYILIDLNPSISAINQAILLSSDFFIVPTSPDFFSLMAIKSLSNILPKWEKWAISAREHFSTAVYPFPTGIPKFLGYTVNDFNIRKSEPATNVKSMIEKIDQIINDTLAPKLKQSNMILDTNINSSYRIAEIPNFNTLMQRSQEYSVPVFKLNNEQLNSVGTVLENQQSSVESFNKTYSELSEKIKDIIKNEESNRSIEA
ncbi:MAG: hypothetical protein EAZ85_01560 [Bacteroidetes bacterium]|nr:MAG: hypothetical protein EAZ85_01560 [Bacteroidota bacterium]